MSMRTVSAKTNSLLFFFCSMIEEWDSLNEVPFDIHAVIDCKVQNDVQLYNVQWTDYPDAFNRWEVEDNLGDKVDRTQML